MKNDYLIKPISKDKKTASIFFNEVFNQLKNEKQEFLLTGEVLYEQYEQDDSVRYYFNSLGFRSDEFTKNHDGEHVVFAGCSETEGAGGNLDSNWAHIIYTKISQTKKLSGFFNLGMSGWGHEPIISNIMSYINEYGKPDKIYILFPNIGRYLKWEEHDGNLEYYNYLVTPPYKSIDGEDHYYLNECVTIEEHRRLLVNFTLIVRLFEEYCISNNIELVWSTWDQIDAKNYQKIGTFKKFIKMIQATEFVKNNKDFFIENIKIQKNWDRKRDGHHGYLYHYIWSHQFLGLIDSSQYK
jgi:hypothetical protein